jgi:nitrite reductase/ring-hydroxylating ferredoxin subunit
MTGSSSIPKEEQETLVQNNTFTSPFNLLPRLSFKKNKNNVETNSSNNTTEAIPTLLEKTWFYRKRLRPLNSTVVDIKYANRGRGFFSRLLQYIPLLPKSSGERLLDTEVQLTKTFGNTNITVSSSSSITPSFLNPTTLKMAPPRPPKLNTARDNIRPPDTRINSTQTDSNYFIDLFFSIPYWFKESMDSITASMRNSRDEEWITVCPKTQVSPGAIVPVIAGGVDLLIIASKDGKRVYCVANSCPHLGTPLETGMLEQRPTSDRMNPGTLVKRKSLSTGGMVSSPTVFSSTDVEGSSEACIVCPLHRTAFALESGEVRGPWCPYPPIIGAMVGLVKPITKLPTFAIRTRGKNIEVLFNSRVNEMDAE